MELFTDPVSETIRRNRLWLEQHEEPFLNYQQRVDQITAELSGLTYQEYLDKVTKQSNDL